MIVQDDSDVEHESEDTAFDENTDNVDEIMCHELMNLDVDNSSENAIMQCTCTETISTSESQRRRRKRKKAVITQADIDELRSLLIIERKKKLAKYSQSALRALAREEKISVGRYVDSPRLIESINTHVLS